METQRCHAIDCPCQIRLGLFMCHKHWMMVPPALQLEITRTYRAIRKGRAGAFKEYRAATFAAVEHVEQLETSGLRKELVA